MGIVKGVINDIFKDMFQEVKTNVWTCGGFPFLIGLCQESTLSPFLFAIVIHELSNHMVVCG